MTTMLRRFGEQRVVVALLVWEKLLDGGEDHAARLDRQLGAEIGPTRCLRRRLAQQIVTAGEGAKQLIVEVVAVGQHDDGRIGHRRLSNDAPGVERHGQTLARALGMPHHADPPVARITARLAAGFVASAGLGYSLAQLGCP